MITRGDMIDVLVAACPSYAPQWKQLQDEWRAEGDDVPLYLALSGFARHIIGMVERGETSTLPDVFAAIERLHIEGDLYVREAATVGILEGLQNRNLHSNTTEPGQLRPYLGPLSARSWDQLNRFWTHCEPLNDD